MIHVYLLLRAKNRMHKMSLKEYIIGMNILLLLLFYWELNISCLLKGKFSYLVIFHSLNLVTLEKK